MAKKMEEGGKERKKQRDDIGCQRVGQELREAGRLLEGSPG